MQRVFPHVLVACISEARPPSPDEMSVFAAKIRNEAFPGDPAPQAWECAWCIACAALGGALGLDTCWSDAVTHMILTYGTSLTIETPLDAQVHGSAADAWVRVRLMEASGIEAMILGPDGEKLNGEDLGEFVNRECQMRVDRLSGSAD